MTREGLIRALRRYAKRRGLSFMVDTKRGNGSHYIVEIGAERTTLQHTLNPGRIERALRQLKIDRFDL